MAAAAVALTTTATGTWTIWTTGRRRLVGRCRRRSTWTCARLSCLAAASCRFEGRSRVEAAWFVNIVVVVVVVVVVVIHAPVAVLIDSVSGGAAAVLSARRSFCA